MGRGHPYSELRILKVLVRTASAGAHGSQGTEEMCQPNETIIDYLPYVHDYLKWVWMLRDSRVIVSGRVGICDWMSTGKCVRLHRIWRKGIKPVEER